MHVQFSVFIIAELQQEGEYISYPTLMQKLGIMIAKHELKLIKTMDKRRLYQTIPNQIKLEEVKQWKK